MHVPEYRGGLWGHTSDEVEALVSQSSEVLECEPEQAAVCPPIGLQLLGKITGFVGDNPPVCPHCEGALDLSQPGIYDDGQHEFVGLCLDCDRLTLVLELLVPMRICICLPSREEATQQVLRALCTA